MTVKELIQELSSYPEDAEVWTISNFRVMGSKLEKPLKVKLYLDDCFKIKSRSVEEIHEYRPIEKALGDSGLYDDDGRYMK